MSNRPAQKGYLLVAVSVGLVLLSVVALLLLDSTSRDVSINNRQQAERSLQYVLQAGAAHARWQLRQNTTCNNYGSLPLSNFGSDTYRADVTPGLGSPVDVTVLAADQLGNTLSSAMVQFPMLQPAATIILQPGSEGMDSFIEREDGHTDHNKGDDKKLKTDSETDKEYRSLLQFDLSSIPPRSTVQSATFDIYLDTTKGQTDTVYVNALTRSWDEDVVTWLKPTSGWLSYWSPAGGDFEGQGFGSFVADNPGWKSVDIAELVQVWVTNPAVNHGMILWSMPASGDNKKEYHSSDADDPTLRPKLVVTFSCECGVDCSALIQSGHLAHWTFDETSGNVAVDSMGGHNGDVSGATWVGGAVDGALSFDGNNDYVHVDAASGIENIFAGGGSVTAWIRPSDWGELDAGRVADKAGANSGNRDGWAIGMRGSAALEINQGFSGNVGHWATPDDSLALDSWFHIAVIYDSSSSANDPVVYINGVEQTLAEHSAPSGTLRSDAGVDLRIGNFSGGTDRSFQGLIDDVRLYGDMLSAAEIAELYALGVPDPIAHWKLDETGGADEAKDSVGDNDADLTGLGFWEPGQVDGALNLSGIGWLTVKEEDELDITSALTMMAWINTNTGLFNTQRIVSKESVASNDNYWLSIQGNALWLGIGGQFFSPITTITAGTWYHVAATFDDAADQVVVYLDGVSVLTESTTATITPNNADLYIGSNWEAKLWGGILDDVRLYDQALTAAQISNIYADGAGGGGGGSPLTGSRQFRDEFNTEGSYSGSDGTDSWSSDWIEINESGSASSGDIRVRSDSGEFYVLRIRDNDGGGEGVYREMDLSGCSSTTINFRYRRDGLDNTNDYVTVDISGDGGSTWTELQRFQGSGTDSSYQSSSLVDTTHLNSNTQIRFLSSPNLGSNDEVYFDDVEVLATC
ncbi:MAG: LamG-like jellyroll fold domain-containing protein [Pseudomonadota bacterium]